MSDPVEPLILDLLEWIGPRPRPYSEVIDAWRTSCPRLPVWEEANARGYVLHVHEPERPACVTLTFAGLLQVRRRPFSGGRGAPPVAPPLPNMEGPL